MRIMRRLFFSSAFAYAILILICTGSNACAQDLGGARVGTANFVRRMYNVQPFSGVKVLQSETGNEFIISVVELKNDPGKSETTQNQIAAVKGKAYVSQYLNSSHISTEVVMITSEERSADSVVQKTAFIETIQESSSGFVNGLELLIKFVNERGDKMVYVFCREIQRRNKT